MIAALLLAGQPASSPTLGPLKTTTFQCGRAEFTISTQRWANRPAPLAPVKQDMRVRSMGRQVAVKLEPTHTVEKYGYRVQDRYVLSWACLKGVHGAHYTTLGYACAIDRGYPDDCGGEQEWIRLLDERGRFVDTGVPHDGPASDRLYRRLGIYKAFEAGVQMKEAF